MKVLNRGRTIRTSLPELLRMLDEDQEGALSRMMGAFRGGETDFIKYAAEIVVIRELKDSLLMAVQQSDNEERKLHERYESERDADANR